MTTSNDPRTPAYVRFGGILEARSDQPAAVRHATESLQRLSPPGATLEIDGPRILITFDVEWSVGDPLTEERKSQITSALREVIEHTDGNAPIESTLHCREIYEDTVVETMFGVQAGQLKTLTRERSIEDEDRRVPPELSAPRAFGRAMGRLGAKRTLALFLLLVVALLGAAWQRNYLGRLFSPAADKIEYSATTLETGLTIQIDKSWGQYLITIGRGDDYPASLEAARNWEESASTLDQRALRRVVLSGGNLFVRMLDEDGRALASERCSLQSLLEPAGTVTVEIPGYLSASRIELSLSEK